MCDLKKTKALVIGGSGFVGQALVKKLLKNECDVTLLNRGHKLIEKTQQLIADRTISSQMKKAAEMAPHSFDVVIDISSYSQENSEIAWECFAHHTPHWIHLSTVAVYKSSQKRPPLETDEIGGAEIWRDYGRTKSEAEFFLQTQILGPRVTILRPPYIYGPGNNLDRETFIWSRVLQGKPVIIPGDGNTPLQFIHVDDLSEFFVYAFFRSNESHVAVYNVAAREQVTMKQYVASLADIIGLSDPGVCGGTETSGFNARQYFPFRDYPCWANVDKIHADLGWQQQFSFSDGFKQTWYSLDHDMLKERNLDTSVESQILARVNL